MKVTIHVNTLKKDKILSRLMHKFAPLIVVVALISCGEKQDVEYSPEYTSVPLAVGDKEFIIGVHPMHNPKMLHAVFGPIADYLTKNTSWRVMLFRRLAYPEDGFSLKIPEQYPGASPL